MFLIRLIKIPYLEREILLPLLDFFHFSEFKQLVAFDIHITKQYKLPIIRYYDRNNIH